MEIVVHKRLDLQPVNKLPCDYKILLSSAIYAARFTKKLSHATSKEV